jgi:hypothetical protein
MDLGSARAPYGRRSRDSERGFQRSADRPRMSAAQAIITNMVIVIPQTRPMRKTKVPGLAYILNGCSNRANSSAPIRTDKLSVMTKRRYALSLDRIVGTGEQPRRHFDAEHFGSPEIEDQFKPGRLFNGHIGYFSASQKLRDLTGTLTKNHAKTGTIGYQAACFGIFRPLQNGRQAMQSEAVTDQQTELATQNGRCQNIDCVDPSRLHGVYGPDDFVLRPRGKRNDFDP